MKFIEFIFVALICIGVGFLIGLEVDQKYPKSPDCRYERFASDSQSMAAAFVVDACNLVVVDAVTTCYAKLRHCGCLRGDEPEIFED